MPPTTSTSTGRTSAIARSFLPEGAALDRFSSRRAPMLFTMLRCTDGAEEAFASAVRSVGGEIPWRARCDSLFIGDGPDHWTHAAVVRFPSKDALTAASEAKPTVEGLEDVQAHRVHGGPPPLPVRIIAPLLRLIGRFLRPKPAALEAFLDPERVEEGVGELMGDFGGLHPTRAQVERHLGNTRETPAFMINLLKMRELAAYDEPVRNPDVSGNVAYNRRYGLVAIRSVMMLGGIPVWIGPMGPVVVEADVETAAAGEWDSIAVVRYPRPRSLFELEFIPGYRDAVKHRRAGLERTALYITG